MHHLPVHRITCMHEHNNTSGQWSLKLGLYGIEKQVMGANVYPDLQIFETVGCLDIERCDGQWQVTTGQMSQFI